MYCEWVRNKAMQYLRSKYLVWFMSMHLITFKRIVAAIFVLLRKRGYWNKIEPNLIQKVQSKLTESWFIELTFDQIFVEWYIYQKYDSSNDFLLLKINYLSNKKIKTRLKIKVEKRRIESFDCVRSIQVQPRHFLIDDEPSIS